MKKTMLLLSFFLLGFTLSACSPAEDPDPQCDINQELVDGECVDNEPDAYDPRSLVPEECEALENIDDWQPVWCEEFDYEGLPNPEKWFYDIGGDGWGNNEEQYYTNADLDNANVSDGTLKITALKENFSGSSYTSARLISKYRGDFTYGRFEVRAKMPTAKGTWSAIWMLPTDWEYGGWPESGEIDIMEHVGYDLGKIHGTIHTEQFNHKANTQIGYSKTLDTAEEEFHTYELVWEPHYIEFFVDGDSYGQVGYNALLNRGRDAFEAWPFDKAFHLILNVAVGGSWGVLQGIDEDAFPSTMEVDYVRVYQKDYAGMDEEAPSPVENVALIGTESTLLEFMWDYAEDDVKVKEYQIFVNDELHGTSSVNSYRAHDLDPDTQYTIDIVTVDFAGNTSDKVTYTFTTSSLATIDGRIEAEDYDSQSGVAREDTNDAGGGQHVTFINNDDYMEYELYVTDPGTYKITYRIASDKLGEIKLYGRTRLPLATTEIPNSGSLETWIDVESDTFTLVEGIYTFRILVTEDGMDINYFEFTKVE